MDKHKLTSLFHVLAVSAYFIYLFLYKTEVHTYNFWVLMVLGVGIAGYHAYKMAMKGTWNWVNGMHMFLIAPMLFATGYMGKNAPRYMFEWIGMLGFAALGYHVYYLVI